MSKATLHVYRGDNESGKHEEYSIDVAEGMVVLDAIHEIQAHQATDLAVRWNCKAGKCGSCSAEINGKPRLMCMTRMNTFNEDEIITVSPLKAFPVIKDLITDVSWNYETAKNIQPFTPKKNAHWKFHQEDIDRVQEFRKCIECWLCQNTCHILRDHDKKDKFIGPAMMIKVAGLEMHPMDSADRTQWLKEEGGGGMCNITKCCTEACPESIQITDNAIIPLKERVADKFYDPLKILWKKLFGNRK